MKTIWALAAAAGGLAAAGAAWQTVATREDLRRFPPPGETATLGNGQRLHFLRLPGPPGPAPPTVVLEAALGASSLGWTPILPAVAAFAPVLAYDRAGLGWSAAPPAGPHRAGREMVEDLRELLALTHTPRPVILAGHSYGGLLARLYAALHPEEIAGLVLVDAAAPEQWTQVSPKDRMRLKVGRHLARRGIWAARLGVARLVKELVTARRRPGAPRKAPEAAARAVVTALTLGILGPSDRGLLTPVANLSPEIRQALARLWVQPKFYAAIAEQIAALPALAADVAALERPLRVPVGVISASEPLPGRLAEQEAAARLSPQGWHIVAPPCGHWVQLDQPACVIAAIRRVAVAAQAAKA